MSLTEPASKVAHALPAAWLLSWAAGVPWDMVAAFLACLYTLGLMWQSWLWKPYLKPWLQARSARG